MRNYILKYNPKKKRGINMNVEYIVNELKANGTVAVAEKIDMNDKKLRKALKAAGYEYSRKVVEVGILRVQANHL